MEQSGTASARALPDRTIFDSGEGEVDEVERVDAPALERGGTLSRYLLVERVGIGGMGVVWAAYDPELDRKVAIKLLRPRSDGGRMDEARARLVREAQAMARLNHPNVMAIHDVGEHGGQVFLAMEFVQGKTLGRWVRATRRGWREIVAMHIQAGRGLAEAHAAGIIHRDFKPGNVLIGPDNRARVTDFGLARSVESPSPSERDERDGAHSSGSTWSASRIQPIQSPARSRARPDHARQPGESLAGRSLVTPLTRTGSMLGTPAYMAPEQFDAAGFDARSDQFSFCVALWEALHRQRPFSGRSIVELRDNVRRGTITPPPGDSRIPGFLDRALRRGLARDPAARWPSMDALLAELSREPGTSRRRWVIAGALVASFTTALVLTPLFADEPPASVDPCPDASTELDGVWDPERRHMLGEAVLGLVGAREREGILAALDGYASRWSRQRHAACEVAHADTHGWSDAALAARGRCLDARRDALAARVELLLAGDPELVERWPTLLAGLPSVTACGRIAYAEASSPELVAATTEAVEHELSSPRRRLAKARARIELGRHAEALAELDLLERELEPHARASLAAELLRARGLAERSAGRLDRAQTLLEAAVAEAIRTRQDALAAASATELIELVGRERGRTEAGLRWAARAEAWHERVDAPAIERARRALAEAELRRGGGPDEHAAAERSYASALGLLGLGELPVIVEQPPEPGEALVASRALEGLGLLALARRDLRGARSRLHAAHRLRARAFGPSTADARRLAAALASLDFELGDWSAAAESFAMALPELRRRRHLSPEPYVSAALDYAQLRLARAELRPGELAIVEPEVIAAVDGVLAFDDRASARLVEAAMLVRARLDRLAGRLDQAEAGLARIASLELDAPGPTGGEAVDLVLERGELALARGQLAAALAEFERAGALVGSQPDPRATPDPRAAEAAAGRGRALVELGRPEQARVELERALGIWDALAPEGHPRAVSSLEQLGGLAGGGSGYRRRAEAIRAKLP